MKKAIFLAVGFLFSNMIFAQKFEFGLNGGLNYNFSGDLHELQTLGDDIIHGSEESLGFHGGLYFQGNFDEIFVKLETNYTEYKTTFEGNNNYELQGRRVDAPLLIGAKVLGPVYVFAGPDFQYIISEDFSLENTEVDFDEFTMGLHVGAGIDLGRLSVDVRWEKGLSNSDSQITNSEFVSQNFTLDNRPNQLLVGLNLRLN